MPQSEFESVAEDIVRTIPAVMRTVAMELRHQDEQLVPAQLGILSILAHQSCNMSELAEQHGVSLPTVSSTISKMVSQGWVQRTRSKEDRRVVLLQITPAGQEMVKSIARDVVAATAASLAPLSKDELLTLKNGLAVLQKIYPPFDLLPET